MAIGGRWLGYLHKTHKRGGLEGFPLDENKPSTFVFLVLNDLKPLNQPLIEPKTLSAYLKLLHFFVKFKTLQGNPIGKTPETL
jgi:hypothetical protein